MDWLEALANSLMGLGFAWLIADHFGFNPFPAMFPPAPEQPAPIDPDDFDWDNFPEVSELDYYQDTSG